jgi:polyisoprenoid-binding protein YceI
MRALAIAWVLACAATAADASVRSRDPAAVPAGDYVLDREHASVVVRVGHMGFSRYTLRFDRIEGGFSYDPAQPDASQVTAVIDAESLDAGPPNLGRRFADEFLDAKANPKITFVSTGLVRRADGTGTLSGQLTLCGVARPVELNVVFNGVGPGLIGGTRVGFSATGRIRRSDFGSTKDLPTLVGDDVDVEIEAEFYRK